MILRVLTLQAAIIPDPSQLHQMFKEDLLFQMEGCGERKVGFPEVGEHHVPDGGAKEGPA